MSPRELALGFVARFCAGDVEGIAPLLADDLRVRGPLLACDSREAYLNALRSDPPEPGECRLLRVTESGDEASVFYAYRRAGTALTIAQSFRSRSGQIADMLIVFDTREPA